MQRRPWVHACGRRRARRRLYVSAHHCKILQQRDRLREKSQELLARAQELRNGTLRYPHEQMQRVAGELGMDVPEGEQGEQIARALAAAATR